MQLRQRENKTRENSEYIYNVKSMNVHKMYNLFSINHNEILQKKNFFVLKQTVRMQSESVIIKKFQLTSLSLKRIIIF